MYGGTRSCNALLVRMMISIASRDKTFGKEWMVLSWKYKTWGPHFIWTSIVGCTSKVTQRLIICPASWGESASTAILSAGSMTRSKKISLSFLFYYHSSSIYFSLSKSWYHQYNTLTTPHICCAREGPMAEWNVYAMLLNSVVQGENIPNK